MGTKQPQRKAANGDGTINFNKQTKQYRAIISAGVVDGKRKRLYGTWREKERDAKVDLRQMLHDRDRGIVARDGRMTLAQFIDLWLQDVVRPTVRYSTWRQYRARVAVATKVIGQIRLAKLTVQDVQGVLSRMVGAYSDHAIHGTRNVLINALSVAEEWELVPRNVAKRTKVAPIEHPDRPVLSEATVQRLLVAALGTPAHVGVHLGILGLRSGEACALTWQDVDWERHVLAVHGTRVWEPGGMITGPTKTPRSTRAVPLPVATVEALRLRHEEQKCEQYEAGEYWQNTNAILTSRTGRPMDGQTLNLHLHQALERAGLPRMRYHDLRHASASLMASGGIQVHDRMGVLGHSDTAMALHYTHGSDESLRAATDVLGRALTVKTD